MDTYIFLRGLCMYVWVNILILSPLRVKGKTYYICKKDTIQQVTTMLANVLFPDHNHLLTTSTDDPSLAGAQAIIKVLGHQCQWLAGGYDLEIGHFRSG